MEDDEKIETCSSHQLVEAVKSKAVVKYSAPVHIPFHRLECNTNLNLPPSNWLQNYGNYGLHQALFQSPGFPSFNMAHMFPDCVGEVDVVSDAENIKKLLKLPYSAKGAVSMIVHKVGNTLLLDEFDIQKYLLRKANDDWNWLRTFILDQLIEYGESDNHFCLKDKSREAIQTKNLLSKFLYYSLTQQSCSGVRVDSATNEKQPPLPLPLTGPVLPEPKVEANMPDPKSSHVFNRNVVWTFEDIRMLIGTDMPIFGGPNRPCISLRLRDVKKPINILTGIDYWLDNLMCNVPEVLMCYHLDGIVQKYEIIKTEDLPHLENSQFSPQVVRNVAQNILAFLKANATKAGHTYWLFKGRNDDVVKLYDLTTLCANEAGEEKEENPFTVPVAMLLYTVARNMKNTAARITPKTAGSIRALLDSCIKLLPKEKYPQIVTSSHYILSDLHIPSGIDPKSPKFESDTRSVYEEDEVDEDEVMDDDENRDDLDLSMERTDTSFSDNVAVINICETLKELQLENNLKNNIKDTHSRAPVPLVASIEERCQIALEHISEGISCLQFFNSNEEHCVKESEARAKDEEKQRILIEEQNPNMAKPFKPIPLPYESLNTNNHLSNEQRKDCIPTSTQFEGTSKQNKEKERKLKKKEQKTKVRSKVISNAKPLTAQVEMETPASLSQHQRIGSNFNTQLFGSWNVHLKLLLLEKASLTYATLAEHNYGLQKYGVCLKAIYMSYRCEQAVIRSIKTITSQKICLLGRAGDCFFQMSKNWDVIDTYLTEYYQENKIELNIYGELEKDLNDDTGELMDPSRNLEHLMISSYKCYENALNCLSQTEASETTTESCELLRRLGNVRNELGLKYMHWAQEEYEKSKIENQNPEFENDEKSSKKSEPVYINLAMKAYDCLTLGIAAFSKVGDNVNLSFLFCNMGRFMRFRAHLDLVDENYDFAEKRKFFYNEAFKNYEKAREILGSRKANAELWDLVNWELSTATFILAKELQDHSSTQEVNRSSLEKEVLDLLHRSLKICELESSGARQVFYAYRSGLLHKRIASFHYNQLRVAYQNTQSIPHTALQLCKYHYEKAANILDNLKEVSDLLVVQLERISLYEFLADDTSHAKLKIKHMQTVLDICLNTKIVFEHLAQSESGGDNCNLILPDDFESYANLLTERLHNCLKTLIKLLISGKDPKKIADMYKRMYREALTVKPIIGKQKLTTEEFAKNYLDLLTRVKQLECSEVTCN